MAQKKDWEALRIARTETIRSSNFGTHMAHATSGIVEREQWVATLDTDVRDSHLALNGMTKHISELWEIDGDVAPHPGEFELGKNSINCRCTIVAVIDEPKSVTELVAVWRAFDKHSMEWEKGAKARFVRGFNKQETELMDALEATMGKQAGEGQGPRQGQAGHAPEA